LRLNPDLLHDQQAAAGAEIDCPEPPAFGFVGRDGVILELERAFQRETIVLLDGMAGVGKTEATVGFARWWAETGELDGPIFFFRFEHYLPLAQVCDRVGQVFNAVIRQQLQVDWHLLDAAQRCQIALAILRQVPCLLIWDNFEPVAGFPQGTPSVWTPEEQTEIRSFLRDLRGGQTKVLLTSRRDEPWLGTIYRRVAVDGLPLAEAQELAVLILQRAGLQPQDIKALPQYNDLLAYLHGNPLSLQVILPELRHMAPDALLQALQAGEVTLRADDPALGRERSLTASLTYRLDALDPLLRQRLGVLGLFQGFVNAGVLTAMSAANNAPALLRGLGRDDWWRMLDTAAEVGLLRRVGEGYYTVHPALPWFFHDLLREAFPDHLDALERTFAAVYGAYGHHLFRIFQTNAEGAMALLRVEEGNLMHALRLARQHACWDDVEAILYGLNQLLTTQGRWVEWERLLADVEAEATDSSGEPLTGRELLWRALLGHREDMASYRRDFDTQETILHRLKDHYEHTSDDRNNAVALRRLGMVAQERRQFEEAERWYRQSLAIKGSFGNEHGQAITLHQLGRIAQERRQFEEAERWYRQSLAITERLGDEHGQATALHQLGRIAEERGNVAEAVQFYERAETLVARLNDPYSLDIVRRSLQGVWGKNRA
jgi:tetratricopeptide (TPR) repeat protein